MIPLLTMFFAGLLFASGLGLSGMTLPAKVLGFLDVTGHWDPSLLFVMGAAIPIYAVAYRFSLRARKPLLAKVFPDAPAPLLDRTLIAGAVLFGAGWGISGVCPGPAIVNLGGLAPGAALFCAAMAGGMLLQGWISRRRVTPGAGLPPFPLIDRDPTATTPPSVQG